MKAVPVEEAAEKHVLHDMTQVIPDQKKGRHSNRTGSFIKG